MIILKCANCGNTFRIENAVQDKLVTCPICEADYKVFFEEGRIRLKESLFDGDEAADSYSFNET